MGCILDTKLSPGWLESGACPVGVGGKNMHRLFSEIGIRAIDFIQISSGFLLTILCFFGAKHKKYLNRFLLLVFALQCAFLIVFGVGLRVKFFVALVLLATIIVEAVVTKIRKGEISQLSAAN